jgi:hypothetical protein
VLGRKAGVASHLQKLFPKIIVWHCSNHAMLNGSLVTTAWCVLRLRMEEKASRYGG